eukprot:NODE_82_length_22708_cov_0.383476.p16 type:complete len:111 gc:universal NODE_82_length_22708_cov_0.383476:10307-10639(+)
MYALCNRSRVVITPEFRTSKLCCKCHQILTKETISFDGQRQLLFRNFLFVFNRDMNASIRIEEAVNCYCSTSRKFEWQGMNFEATILWDTHSVHQETPIQCNALHFSDKE